LAFSREQWEEVHLLYLQLLENLNYAGSLSWGSTILVFLYKSMCECALKYKDFTRCAILMYVVVGMASTPGHSSEASYKPCDFVSYYFKVG
jgi:hypothetical protein